MNNLIAAFGPMLTKALADRVAPANSSSPGEHPGAFVLRIPKDDKKGMQLVAFIESLATRVEMPSGLVIEKGFKDADFRIKTILEALKDYLEAQGVDFESLCRESFGRSIEGTKLPSQKEIGDLLRLAFSKAPPAVLHKALAHPHFHG